MKRGQVSTGMVILGVVAIIAVIGLVLLFTRAGTDGAGAEGLAIGSPYGANQYAKGVREYNPQTKGIGITYPLESNKLGPSRQYAASVGELPQFGAKVTVGSRTPAFVLTRGYSSLEDMYACNQDLVLGTGIRNVEELFNCYAVPVKGTQGEVSGYYPRASSAYSRPRDGVVGKTGGDMYCYANSVGAEQQVPNSERLISTNILDRLVKQKNPNAEHQWDSVMMNGVEVPRCWVSQNENYVFPQ